MKTDSIMDRIRALLGQKQEREDYEPLAPDAEPMECSSLLQDGKEEVPFSWMEYSIFALLGMAMLWAW